MTIARPAILSGLLIVILVEAQPVDGQIIDATEIVESCSGHLQGQLCTDTLLTRQRARDCHGDDRSSDMISDALTM